MPNQWSNGLRTVDPLFTHTHIRFQRVCMCKYAYCTVCRFTVHWVWVYTVALKYYVTVFRAELIAPRASLTNRCISKQNNWLNSAWACPSFGLSLSCLQTFLLQLINVLTCFVLFCYDNKYFLSHIFFSFNHHSYRRQIRLVDRG